MLVLSGLHPIQGGLAIVYKSLGPIALGYVHTTKFIAQAKHRQTRPPHWSINNHV